MRSPSACATRAMLRGSRWRCGLPAACVAHRAVHPRRLLEQRHDARRLEVARLARLDLRVARLRLHQRHPADSRARRRCRSRGRRCGRARSGSAAPRCDAGPAVRSRRRTRSALSPPSSRASAPHSGSQAKIVERSVRASRERKARSRKEKSHDGPQKVCAPCAPRLRMYCSSTWLSVHAGARLVGGELRRTRLNSDGLQSTIGVLRVGL